MPEDSPSENHPLSDQAGNQLQYIAATANQISRLNATLQVVLGEVAALRAELTDEDPQESVDRVFDKLQDLEKDEIDIVSTLLDGSSVD